MAAENLRPRGRARPQAGLEAIEEPARKPMIQASRVSWLLSSRSSTAAQRATSAGPMSDRSPPF